MKSTTGKAPGAPSPRKPRILVIDDDRDAVEYLVEALVERGYDATGLTDPREALARATTTEFDVVVSDVEMPHMRGLDLLSAFLTKRPGQLVILATAFGSIDLAVQAVRAGAADFVTKPFPIEALDLALTRALRERELRHELVRLRKALPESGMGELVAKSASMQRVLEMARRAADTTFAVLITGESGTGKSRLAQFVHAHSARRRKPFVQLNCAALPETLVESELFGVKKGAFTGALDDRPGVFVEADGGTLFLDEIGELPLETQPKLLHALETGSIRAVGGRAETPVDVRIVAATNTALESALRERRIRPDLYFRLNVIRIEMPPLRERSEDIPALVDVLLERASVRLGRSIRGLSTEALRALLARRWDGNVRELSNVLERAIALTDRETLGIEDVAESTMPSAAPSTLPPTAPALGGPMMPLADVERLYVESVLEKTGGNVSAAARILGIDRRTLAKKRGVPADDDEK